jgi:hypothetical protein
MAIEVECLFGCAPLKTLAAGSVHWENHTSPAPRSSRTSTARAGQMSNTIKPACRVPDRPPGRGWRLAVADSVKRFPQHREEPSTLEARVLAEEAHGLSDLEVAARLMLSQRTVRAIVRRQGRDASPTVRFRHRWRSVAVCVRARSPTGGHARDLCQQAARRGDRAKTRTSSVPAVLGSP